MIPFSLEAKYEFLQFETVLLQSGGGSGFHESCSDHYLVAG